MVKDPFSIYATCRRDIVEALTPSTSLHNEYKETLVQSKNVYILFGKNPMYEIVNKPNPLV